MNSSSAPNATSQGRQLVVPTQTPSHGTNQPNIPTTVADVEVANGLVAQAFSHGQATGLPPSLHLTINNHSTNTYDNRTFNDYSTNDNRTSTTSTTTNTTTSNTNTNTNSAGNDGNRDQKLMEMFQKLVDDALSPVKKSSETSASISNDIVKNLMSQIRQQIGEPKVLDFQLDHVSGGNVPATPHRKNDSHPSTVPPFTDAELEMLTHILKTKKQKVVVDMLMAACAEEGIKVDQNQELYKNFTTVVQDVVAFAKGVGSGEIKIPKTVGFLPKQLPVENHSGKDLCKFLGGKVHNHAECCYIAMTDNPYGFKYVDSDYLSQTMTNQRANLDFTQSMDLSYYDADEQDDMEVVLELYSESKENCQSAVGKVLRAVVKARDIRKVAFQGSKDKGCAVEASVLKTMTQIEDLYCHFQDCNFDCAQTWAFSGSKCCLGFENCPMDDSFLAKLCDEGPESGPGLKVVFDKTCPPFSEVAKYVAKNRFACLMFYKIDLKRNNRKLFEEKPEEAFQVIASQLIELVESAQRNGCIICLSELTINDKSVKNAEVFKEIHDVWNDEVSNDYIRNLVNSERKPSACPPAISGTQEVLLFEDGTRQIELLRDRNCLRFTGYGNGDQFEMAPGTQVQLSSGGTCVDLGEDGMLTYTFAGGASKRCKVPVKATKEKIYCATCAKSIRPCRHHSAVDGP